MNPSNEHEEEILKSLRRAVGNALERKRRLGQRAVFWIDGKVVEKIPEKRKEFSEQTTSISADSSNRYGESDG